MRLLLALLIFALSSVAFAQSKNLQGAQQGITTPVLATTPINVACQADTTTVLTASLTCAAFELNTQGFTKIWLLVEYTFATASFIQIFQDGALDTTSPPDKVPEVPWAIFQRPTPATGGQVDLDNEFGNKPVSVSTAFIVEYDINSPFTRWRFESTGGAAGDTVRVFVVRRGP